MLVETVIQLCVAVLLNCIALNSKVILIFCPCAFMSNGQCAVTHQMDMQCQSPADSVMILELCVCV